MPFHAGQAAVGVRGSPGGLLLGAQPAPPSHNKKTKEGAAETLALLRRAFPESERHLTKRPLRVGADDLMDVPSRLGRLCVGIAAKQNASVRRNTMRRGWRLPSTTNE